MTTILDELGLTGEEIGFLEQYLFDARQFERLRGELMAGSFAPDRNVTPHEVAPPRPEDLIPWPEKDSQTAKEWQEAGTEAIAAGKVGAVILNGGMATRFGGGVKGVVEVLDGHSFLGLKLSDIGRANPGIHTFLMNSFATTEETERHLQTHRDFGLEQLHRLNQRISLRLTRSGELVRDEHGRLNHYAPGHGDVFEVLHQSEAFQNFAAAGGELVMISNVDNLGATFSAKVIGAHLASGKSLTVEVAPRQTNDRGGAPVLHRGRLEVLEGFRFPPSFDIATVPVFNTNTLLLRTEAVRSDYGLSWFRADKQANGRNVIQFERLMGEVTSFVDAAYLSVPRDGPEGRFLPVKTPDDLVTVRPAVRRRFGM